MQQSQVSFDPSVCHSKLQANQTVCGLGYFQDKEDQVQLVMEAIEYYRLMVFYKNYPYSGSADLTLVYLWVVLTHMIKTIEKEKSADGAKKKLQEIARQAIPGPNDKQNFMGGLVREGDRTENDMYQSYLKSLKEILVEEILKILYQNGQQSLDFKFWVGVSKRKFMGMSYTGL